MRILVLSDTHIPISAPHLPHQIVKELRNSDLCIHAGDFVDIEVVQEISKYVKLEAVRGNMDSPEIRKRFSEKKVLLLEQVKIGLTHGSGGSPTGAIERAQGAFSEDLDIYIFGHTHLTLNEIHNQKIFFNPGSSTDKLFTDVNSYGILQIKGKNIDREIVNFDPTYG